MKFSALAASLLVATAAAEGANIKSSITQRLRGVDTPVTKTCTKSDCRDCPSSATCKWMDKIDTNKPGDCPGHFCMPTTPAGCGCEAAAGSVTTFEGALLETAPVGGVYIGGGASGPTEENKKIMAEMKAKSGGDFGITMP